MNMSLQSEVPEGGASQLAVKWNTGKTTYVDMAEWQEGPDPLYKRSDIVFAIIYNRSIQHLEDILRLGWDVNEVLDIPQNVFKAQNDYHGYEFERCQSTALLEAIKNWKEIVEFLLKAGADCNLTPTFLSPLEQAITYRYNSNDQEKIVRLLLEHGANPKIQSNTSKGIVGLAIKYTCGIKTVELLLQNGAHPNGKTNEASKVSENSSLVNVLHSVVAQIRIRKNYDDSWTQEIESNIVLFKMLLDYGADINWTQENQQTLVHRLVLSVNPYLMRFNPPFLPNHLDLVFQYGGHLDTLRYGDDKDSALEFAVTHGGQSNSIRWLLRHGADTTSLQMNFLKKYFIPFDISFRGRHGTRLIKRIMMNDTPLMLLKAGMRVSPGVQFQLSEIKKTTERFIEQDHNEGPTNSPCGITDMWDKVHKADEANVLCARNFPRMTISPSERKQQQADLQEFSDESLNVYPETDLMENRDQLWQCSQKMVQKTLDFLSQPQTLQAWCRCCIRESLVSLHPSVVKNLPVPARLKRYILCHEL